MLATELIEFMIWHDRYQGSHGFQIGIKLGIAGECISEVHIKLRRKLNLCEKAPVVGG